MVWNLISQFYFCICVYVYVYVFIYLLLMFSFSCGFCRRGRNRLLLGLGGKAVLDPVLEVTKILSLVVA